MPALFVPHGSPPLPLWPCKSARFLASIAQNCDIIPRKPRCIVFMSPHWVSDDPKVFSVSACLRPCTMYDFDEDTDPKKRMLLEKLTYPARGEPRVANEVARRIRDAGFTCTVSDTRGFDHGSWTALMLMYPKADIPVVSLSVKADLEASDHIKVGRALRSLCDAGSDILIIGSGETVHNVPRMGPSDSAPEAWCVDFENWLERTAALKNTDGDRDARLSKWRSLAPKSLVAHPLSEPWPASKNLEEPFVSPGEHLMPWFFAYGAGGPHAETECVSREYLGSLPMSGYTFKD